MNLEEIKNMSEDEIISRSAEIKTILETDDANIDELESEVKALEERKAEILKEKEARKSDIAAVIGGMGDDITETIPQNMEEKRTMENTVELRNTQAYIDAFANGIKACYRSGKSDMAECRALLTEGVATGTVPVPQIVYDIISTAWEKDRITQLVKKSYAKGVLRIGVEIVASDAVIHTEGSAAPDAETLILAIVNLAPQTFKKWIQISDEVLDMDSGSFLRYIYDELTYRIAKKAADTLLAKIVACGTVSTNTPTTNIAVGAITTTTISVGLIAEALGKLCDDAANPVVVMNKATWSAFKAVQYAGQFNVDPFEGLEVVFNNSLAAWGTATTGVPFAIVGDFGVGAMMNFPNGDDIKIKYDDLDDGEADLVKIIGRLPVASGVIKENAFVTLKADK